MCKNTILIGIGYAGCKILSKAQTELSRLYLDTDPEVAEKYSGMRIGTNVCGKYSACGDAELAQDAVDESKDEILERIKDFTRVVIVISLGGGTSNGATSRLAEFCLELEKEVCIVTGLPFELEGHRLVRAKNALFQLEDICEVKSVQYEYSGGQISLRDCFNLKDDEVLELLGTVINQKNAEK